MANQETQLLVCASCGAPIDATREVMKTRRYNCMYCGNSGLIPKPHNSGGIEVQTALDEGMRQFLNGNFDSAKNCGERVLAVSKNNVTALFFVNYYKAFSAQTKNTKAFDQVFDEVLPEAEFEVEDEELFKQLCAKTIHHTGAFEEQLLAKFLEYDDPKEVVDFTESFSPVNIMMRQDFEWFTPKIASLYEQIVALGPTPKTAYALYTMCLKNPESPLLTKNWYLKTKVERIYKDVILPLEKIFKNIKDDALRAKFVGGYAKVKAAYEAGMKQG